MFDVNITLAVSGGVPFTEVIENIRNGRRNTNTRSLGMIPGTKIDLLSFIEEHSRYIIKNAAFIDALVALIQHKKIYIPQITVNTSWEKLPDKRLKEIMQDLREPSFLGFFAKESRYADCMKVFSTIDWRDENFTNNHFLTLVIVRMMADMVDIPAM